MGDGNRKGQLGMGNGGRRKEREMERERGERKREKDRIYGKGQLKLGGIWEGDVDT